MKYHVIVRSYGSVYVEANSESEAMDIVSGLNHESFDWTIPENFEVFVSDEEKEEQQNGKIL